MLYSGKNEEVKGVIENTIATITFSSDYRNALSSKSLNFIAKAINDYGTDSRVTAIILKSEGDLAFCSGMSMPELLAIETQEQGGLFFGALADVINAMRKSKRFIISQVQGKTVGAGVGLIAASDYAIALDKSSIKLSELQYGLGPFVAGPAIERKIGTACFSHLAIDANGWRSAEWAKRHGLYSETCPTMEEVRDAVKKLSNSLAHSSVEAMAELKKVLWDKTKHWETLLPERAKMNSKLLLTDFAKEKLSKSQYAAAQ